MLHKCSRHLGVFVDLRKSRAGVGERVVELSSRRLSVIPFCDDKVASVAAWRILTSLVNI